MTLGRTTLVIADTEARALSHWSLPAVERCGPEAEKPAHYTPGEGGGEVLEIAEPAMIAAIERVRRAVARRAPRRRWRRWLPLAVLAAAAVAGAVALPDALRGHAVRVAPPEVRAALGEAVLTRLGAPCEAPAGRAALDALGRGLAPPPPDGDGRTWRIVVLRPGPAGAEALPGGFVAMPAADALAGPEETAAGLAAATEAATAVDPLDRLLAHAGVIATARLLTTARVPDRALDAYAAHLAERPAPAASRAAEVEGLLPAAAWVALRGICDG